MTDPNDLESILRRTLADAGGAAPAHHSLHGLLGAPGAFEMTEAAVTFVSTGDAAALGVRAAGLLEGYQVVIDSGAVTVVLDITPTAGIHDDGSDGDPVDVRGEVLGSDEVVSLQLLDGHAEVALTVSDPYGEFRFHAIPVGRYELVVAGAQRELTVAVELHR